MVRKTRSAGHECSGRRSGSEKTAKPDRMDAAQRSQTRLDRSLLRGKGSKLIGAALYNALDALASLKIMRSHPAWTEERSQSRTQGGVIPGPDSASDYILRFVPKLGSLLSCLKTTINMESSSISYKI